MPRKTLALKFPAAGLSKKLSLQSQPPYTTGDSLNVRPVDSVTQRVRGGSRPGLAKSHYTALGSGNPVRLLNAVTVVSQNGLTFWQDNFDGASLEEGWSTADYPGNSMLVLNNFASVTANNTGGIVRVRPTDLDTGQEYQLETYLVPYDGAHAGDYYIYFGFSAATADPEVTGIVVTLSMPGSSGAYSGHIKRYSAGVVQEEYLFTNGTTGAAQAGWFRVTVTGTLVAVYWLENLLTSNVMTIPAGTGIGFGANATQTGSIALVDSFRVEYNTANNSQNFRRLLVASSNGLLYKEAFLNTFVSVGTPLTLNSDRMLMSAERRQKLYIADCGNPRITGTTTTNGINGTTFDSGAIADWSVYGIDADDDMVVLTNPETGVTAGAYQITTVAAGSLTLTTSASSTAGDADFRIERCPKIYDPIAGTLTRWVATTGLGNVPIGCPLVVTYRDRMVMAGPPVAPHSWYMSRQGDPLDWDYGADAGDAGRAVAGINTESGLLGDPIYALIASGDEYLIFGCENSMWVLRGDPTYGGGLQSLDRNIGIVDKGAYCHGPNGEVIFLSRDGLYNVAPGGGGAQSMSRERIPDELLRLDRAVFEINLAYDVINRGVIISVAGRANGGTVRNYWYDWETKGFFPESPALTSYDATSMLAFNATASSDTGVYHGCRDGYVRKHNRWATRDDDDAYSSYIDIGPIRSGTDYEDGYVHELVGVTSQDSSDVAFALYVGDHHEQAQEATTAFYSGTWDVQGRNYTHRPRARAGSFKIRVSNGETGKAWCFESIQATLGPGGTQRK